MAADDPTLDASDDPTSDPTAVPTDDPRPDGLRRAEALPRARAPLRSA